MSIFCTRSCTKYDLCVPCYIMEHFDIETTKYIRIMPEKYLPRLTEANVGKVADIFDFADIQQIDMLQILAHAEVSPFMLQCPDYVKYCNLYSDADIIMLNEVIDILSPFRMKFDD